MRQLTWRTKSLTNGRGLDTQLTANIGLNVVGGTPAISGNDPRLAVEQIQNRFGLRPVVVQTLTKSVFIVIAANDQLSPANVTFVNLCRAMMNQVVVKPALTAEPSCEDSLKNDFIRHVNVNDRVDVVTFEKEFCLSTVTWETIENEPKVPVMNGQSITNDLLDLFIVHHMAIGDQAFDASSQFRMGLNVPAKNISDRDVDQIKILLESLGLRSFSAALRSHNDVLVHDVLQ